MNDMYTEAEMRRLLQHWVADHPTQKWTARQLGISAQYLCDLLKGKRPISVAVAEALHMERVVICRKTYRQRSA